MLCYCEGRAKNRNELYFYLRGAEFVDTYLNMGSRGPRPVQCAPAHAASTLAHYLYHIINHAPNALHISRKYRSHL